MFLAWLCLIKKIEKNSNIHFINAYGTFQTFACHYVAMHLSSVDKQKLKIFQKRYSSKSMSFRCCCCFSKRLANLVSYVEFLTLNGIRIGRLTRQHQLNIPLKNRVIFFSIFSFFILWTFPFVDVGTLVMTLNNTREEWHTKPNTTSMISSRKLLSVSLMYSSQLIFFGVWKNIIPLQHCPILYSIYLSTYLSVYLSLTIYLTSVNVVNWYSLAFPSREEVCDLYVG